MNNAPSLVCPSQEKVDLERLLREIPKYKPWVSPVSFEQWIKFADEARPLFTTVNPDVLWPLPILKLTASRRPVAANNTTELSDSTRALLAKDFTVPKTVCAVLNSTYLYLCTILNSFFFCKISTTGYHACYKSFRSFITSVGSLAFQGFITKYLLIYIFY